MNDARGRTSSRLRKAPGVFLVMSLALSAGMRPHPLPGQAPPGTPAIRSQVVESGTNAVLQAVSPVNEEVVWVSGHRGVILRSLDGGLTWAPVPAPAGDTLQFRDVKAFSTEEAVVLSAGTGALSRIYRTDDAGRSWHTSFLMEHPQGFLDCLDFWDGRRGFAYGDAIDGAPYVLLTDDGGRTWWRAPVDGLPAAREGEGGFAASGTCAEAGEGGRGWIATGAGGSARVLGTTDHGSSWSASDLPIATGSMAGAFTIAVYAGQPTMILGGDLGREEEVVANAARPAEGKGWTQTAVPAPMSGAVYGSAASGPEEVVAFGPAGSAYTPDAGRSWQDLPEVEAWAGAFHAGAGKGWAVGTRGRIWVLTRADGAQGR